MTTPPAQHYYLRGQEHYVRTTPEDNDAAVANFKKALELNPRYALSYVGLSLAYSQRAADLNLGRVWLDDAVAAAERAIAIDDKLPEAYRALWVAYNPKLHLGKMREAVRRRVELNPDDAEALRNMGWLLWFTGHADEALPHLKKALQLDPTSHWGHFFVGNASLALELYTQAEEFYGKSIQLKPNLSSGHIGLICTYLSQGKEEQAIEQNRRFRANPDEDRYFVKAADVELLLGNAEQARAFAEQGAAHVPDARYYPRGVCATTILGCVLWDDDRAEAQRRLDQSISLDRERLDRGDESSIPRYDFAAANAIQGNKDEACRCLQSAIEAGWRTYRLAMRDPLLLNLGDYQRFQQVMRLVAEKIAEAR
jgi:tetratricopeptide (TPR) repeat protein